MTFLPLHVYSGHSFLKSGLSLPHYVALGKKAGYSALGLSDFDSLGGLAEFHTICKSQGINPVFGIDLRIEDFGLCLYIQNEEGYQNLIHLAYLASKEELTLEEIIKHVDGTKAVLDLDSPTLIRLSREGESAFASFLHEKFHGIPDLSLGLPYLIGQAEYVAFCRDFVARYPYPLFAFPFIRYARSEDAISLAIVEAIAAKETLKEKKQSGTQYFLDEEILRSFYSEEELQATWNIARDINFTFGKKRGELAQYPCPEGIDAPTLLRQKALIGLREKVKNPDERYLNRLEYELGVIISMGYANYFLIVADYVNWAKTHGVSVGPGRGSAAASLVAYCLNLIVADPLEYNLFFERFLNPERSSMPDIDVDFADSGHATILSYIRQTYGEDRVAHIVGLDTLGAKGSIRDVGKVYGYPENHISKLCAAIGDSNSSLRDNYRRNPAFRSLVDSDPFYLEIVSLASKIEGLPRQPTLHASGIVVNELPLEQVIPIAEHQTAGKVVQYEMIYLEEQGVLKMDVLSVANISLVDRVLEIIRLSQGKTIPYASLPYDDPKALSVIASGRTSCIFQLKSAGMRSAIAQIHPTAFADVLAIIALYRPGPMENIPSFARRKAGVERVTYLSPLLEPILKETYGIIVYQEQIMQIVVALTGCSVGKADLFRRAIAKKDAAKLGALEGDFLNGCFERGIETATARKIYDLIFKFADYGFNKSHALSYAILACQMAYLKAHYPLAFYCAALETTSSSDDDFASLISEIKTANIHFALPSINYSRDRFFPSEGRIMFPLTGIRGVSKQLALGIIEERELHGAYADPFDFAARNKKNGLTLESFVRLVDAGALDGFGPNRASLRLGAPLAMQYAEMLFGISGQQLLLDLSFPKPELPSAPEDKMIDLLAERETLGLMVSGSPLFQKEEEIARLGLHRLAELSNLYGENEYAAVVDSVVVRLTKRGEKMAIVTLYDESRFIEVVLFAEAYNSSYPSLKEGTIVRAKIYKNTKREGYLATQIIAL